MNDLYMLCNVSKQAHFQNLKRQILEASKAILYVNFIEEVRQTHPGMGLRTIYERFHPENIGRDAFIHLGVDHGYALNEVIKSTRTTFSTKSNRYKNLASGRRFTDVNQIWSGDLTYFGLPNGTFLYIVFIMDVYSRRIIGYSAADNMRAENNIQALQMALATRGTANYQEQLVHHSDRGSQYISDNYTEILEKYGILISMCTEVYENPHIERVNGIIKNDYLKYWKIPDLTTLIKMLEKAVNAYNYDKPHASLPSKMSPIEFELVLLSGTITKRPILEIFTYDRRNNQNPNQLELPF